MFCLRSCDGFRKKHFTNSIIKSFHKIRVRIYRVKGVSAGRVLVLIQVASLARHGDGIFIPLSRRIVVVYRLRKSTALPTSCFWDFRRQKQLSPGYLLFGGAYTPNDAVCRHCSGGHRPRQHSASMLECSRHRAELKRFNPISHQFLPKGKKRRLTVS